MGAFLFLLLFYVYQRVDLTRLKLEYVMKEQEIGYVSKYFGKISVAAIEITAGKLSLGDTIHIKGHTTDINVKINSMQVDHEAVDSVKKKDNIGVKVDGKVRRRDKVYKLVV